jgi:DNA-binding NtrC family response regulator
MAITSVVVADDEFLNRDLLEEIFQRMAIAVRTTKDGVQALKALEDQPADLLLTDIRMPGMGGLKLLAKAREKWPDMPVVMMTAYASVESAIESMRQGAYDYLMKPFNLEQVESLLLRLNERQKLVREVRVLREEVRDRHRAREFLGESAVMGEIFRTIERAARSTATILVRGDSGTGKELVARALHESSPRADGPFIKVNCAALTETLLASEMFGHEQGSFTGADKQRIGRFELANGGTLLLDEVSEISADLQAKLLRVLEERQFERVGGNQPIDVDVRIVATTNRAIEDEVANGNFREDLFYRLNVIPVELPPLRDRGEDIDRLLDHYLVHFGHEMGCRPILTAAGRRLLKSYPWPGNVRELVNIVERLGVLGGEAPLDEHAVHRCIPELQRQAAMAPAADPGGPSSSRAAHGASHGASADDSGCPLAEVERRHILATLDACGDNKQQAAEQLGISVRTWWNRLKQYQEQDTPASA